ncbi:MAG TPA: hypothetical protein VKM55_01635 [Candidatus Lokiarchaeia archaeon]|nr:hypothetical protein [Candidatus Lokiarchaeia archaeon]
MSVQKHSIHDPSNQACGVDRFKRELVSDECPAFGFRNIPLVTPKSPGRHRGLLDKPLSPPIIGINHPPTSCIFLFFHATGVHKR